MGWLSKIILNGVEMLIKDTSARNDAQTALNYLTNMWNRQTGATVYYFSPDGDDETGDGSTLAPYRTIMRAYNDAIRYPVINNNTVVIDVLNGEYYENIEIGNPAMGARVVLNCHGGVVIHGSFVVRNTRVEIIGADAVATLYIRVDAATANNYGNALFVCTEFSEVYCNINSFIIGPESITSIQQAVSVMFGSKLYQGNTCYIRGNYVYNVITVINSEANLNSDVLNSSAPTALYSEHSWVISRNASLSV